MKEDIEELHKLHTKLAQLTEKPEYGLFSWLAMFQQLTKELIVVHKRIGAIK